MKSIVNRLVIAVLLTSLLALSATQLYAQEITILLPFVESGASSSNEPQTKPEALNKAPLVTMVPVRDCSQNNTIVWGAINENPEPRYEIFVRNSDGSGTGWDGFSNEASYTFQGEIPDEVQLARKDGNVVSGWTAWYPVKECSDNTPPPASGSVNNLTNVVIRDEGDPFFTIIWRDSPGGNSAPVDVYRYDRSSNRNAVASGKWDNSGWVDGNQHICEGCNSHAVTVANLGKVFIAADETLFELVWRGSNETISTFGLLDTNLNWSLASTGGGSAPPTNTPANTPTSTPTNAPVNTPTHTPTSTPTNAPTNVPTATPTVSNNGTGDSNGGGSVNNLTNIIVRPESSPFFTIIWKDSPNGGNATVDVYRYIRSGGRDTIATGKWDNSGWIDGNQKLCQSCEAHSVTIDGIGTVSVAGDETLYELIWNGSNGSISTFGIIDASLNWSSATGGTEPPSPATDTPTPTPTPTATAAPMDEPTSTPTATPTSSGNDSSGADVNNLTNITVQPENDPFFTLIWKDSPNGSNAAVDVYYYDASGNRILAKENKWDNSSWLDGNLVLCSSCGSRSISVPNIGTVSLDSDEALFELVWHGPEDISTFLVIDSGLNWSLAVEEPGDDGGSDPNPDDTGTQLQNPESKFRRHTDTHFNSFTNEIIATLQDTTSSNALVLSGPGEGQSYENGKYGDPGDGNFRVSCQWSHFAYDDPIKKFGEPGKSHLHMFFGNTKTNHSSTRDSLIASGGGTCNGFALNRSAYWTPALLDGGGNVVVPSQILIYYKTRTVCENGASKTNGVCDNENYTADMVQQIPQGLQLIAGYGTDRPELRPSADSYQLFWSCGKNGHRDDDSKSGTIPTCSNGVLNATIYFPQCWNGNLSSGDDRSHVSRVGVDKPCPSSHPQRLPEIGILLYFDVQGENTSNWRLSSDEDMNGNLVHARGSTLHADFIGGWHNATMNEWITNCLKGKNNCTMGQIGTDRILNGLNDRSTDWNGPYKYPKPAKPSN